MLSDFFVFYKAFCFRLRFIVLTNKSLSANTFLDLKHIWTNLTKQFDQLKFWMLRLRLDKRNGTEGGDRRCKHDGGLSNHVWRMQGHVTLVQFWCQMKSIGQALEASYGELSWLVRFVILFISSFIKWLLIYTKPLSRWCWICILDLQNYLKLVSLHNAVLLWRYVFLREILTICPPASGDHVVWPKIIGFNWTLWGNCLLQCQTVYFFIS